MSREKSERFIKKNLFEKRTSYYERLENTPVEKSSDSPPTLVELFKHLKNALRQWKSQGYPVTTKLQLINRWRICRECKFWNGWRCLHPKCGCTGIKLVLATEECPIAKWKAES